MLYTHLWLINSARRQPPADGEKVISFLKASLQESDCMYGLASVLSAALSFLLSVSFSLTGHLNRPVSDDYPLTYNTTQWDRSAVVCRKFFVWLITLFVQSVPLWAPVNNQQLLPLCVYLLADSGSLFLIMTGSAVLHDSGCNVSNKSWSCQ